MAPRCFPAVLTGMLVLLAVSFFIPASAVTPLTEAVKWKRPAILTRHFLAHNTKPILYVIHKTWCPACEFMRNEFSSVRPTDEFVRLSHDFIMIEAMDDDEPEGAEFGPDGGYYPRAVLLDPSGTVRTEYLPNKDPGTNFKYTFYYPPQLVEVMKEIKADVDSGAFSPIHLKKQHFMGNRGGMKGPYNKNNPGYSGDGSY